MTDYQVPEKYRVLSGSALKLIALITMIIDHIGAFLLVVWEPAVKPIFAAAPAWLTLYAICRTIGRAAFPIYCFLVAEGARYTHSRKRYGINLLGFALLSEIPWNLVHSGTLRYERQNVFFTLFLGFLCICVCEKLREKPFLGLVALVTLIAFAEYFHADYGSKGMALIVLMYALREKTAVRTVTGCCMLGSPVRELPRFLLLWLYNGKRGFIQGKAGKYFFYAAYPLHILILYLIRSHIFGYDG